MVVNKNNKTVGIITERDYARRIILKGKKSLDTSVKEIMPPFRKNVYCKTRYIY